MTLQNLNSGESPLGIGLFCDPNTLVYENTIVNPGSTTTPALAFGAPSGGTNPAPTALLSGNIYSNYPGSGIYSVAVYSGSDSNQVSGSISLPLQLVASNYVFNVSPGTQFNLTVLNEIGRAHV